MLHVTGIQLMVCKLGFELNTKMVSFLGEMLSVERAVASLRLLINVG